MLRYLFITLDVHEGERVHTHRVLHTTECKNIDFAAEYYAAHFWGYSSREDYGWSAWGGEIFIEVSKVTELIPSEYEYLSSLFYS